MRPTWSISQWLHLHLRGGPNRKLGQHTTSVFGLRLLQKGPDAEDLLFRKVELQKLAMSVDDAAVFEERDTLMRWNYVA